jgi:predicted MFS family arabinose efflux permease
MMIVSANRAETRLATRLSFFVAGFAIACWAPLVPFAKERLGVDDAGLGLLLLCLGVGSVVAMPVTGVLSSRLGARPIIIASGILLALLLPFLAVAATPLTLGLALFGFGASIGSIDIAINVHAVEVERASSRPLMSGFHAMFSIGGFAGASAMTFLLSAHVDALLSAVMGSTLLAIATAVAWPRLLQGSSDAQGPLLVRPRGGVLLLAALAAITFLVEGAMLDWSALLLIDTDLVTPAYGGLGYTMFAIAMTLGRIVGDRIVALVGDRGTLRWGGLIAVAGLAVVLLAPGPAVALVGFLLIGLGASNIVPVLFRQAGAQRAMPAGLAVAAITTVGYAGILIGPAAIGFVARASSLPQAFWLLAALLGLVPLMSVMVSRGDQRSWNGSAP